MDIPVAAAIAGVVLLAVIVTIVYIRKTGAKPIQNAVVLYQDWTERFDLEPLSTDKKDAEKNTKLLNRNLKLLWDKKELEELDLKHEIEGLTQEQALEFSAQANELFLTKTTKGFIYDIRDARDGNLRLIALEKDDRAYKSFIFGQAVIKVLREKATLAEFPDIEFPEGTEEAGLANLESFVIAQAGIDTESESLYAITATLQEKFGGAEWNVYLVSEDVLKFAKAEPEPEVVEEAPSDLSPFAQQKEQKRLAEEAAQAERERIELERRLRWEQAEEKKRQEAIEAREAAIAAGEISALTAKPYAFLSQAIEIAADEAGILSLDDEAEIRRTDRIGNPTLFSVYSDELIDTTADDFKVFTENLIKTLQENYGGVWGFEADSERASSVSFAKSVI